MTNDEDSNSSVWRGVVLHGRVSAENLSKEGRNATEMEDLLSIKERADA